MVAHACDEWGRHAELGPAVAIVRELVTNAVMHARSGLSVTIAQCGPALRICVRDGSPAPPILQPAEPTALHCRGVFLVAALARSWGVLPTGDGGKVVWPSSTPNP